MPVTDPAANSPKEAIRLKLFKEPQKAACAAVQIDPRGATGGMDPELDGFLKQVLTALKAKDDKALQPLFHKRLNISLQAIQETFARLDNTYGAPLDVSVYRLWALNTVDGNPAGLKCEDDRLTVSPMYGYPLQFGVWLQVMGQKELGRIYLSIVPADGHYNLGAFHAQQWTHDSKDFASWTEEAQQATHMGYKEAAYVKYDLASKLLDGGGFIDIALRDDVTKARDLVMPQAAWEKSVKTTLKDYDVVYTSTLLVVGGAGVLARIKVPAELSLETMKTTCRKAAETLAKEAWTTYVEGLRCSFLLPKDDPKADGAMGGLFVPFTEVRPKEAKK